MAPNGCGVLPRSNRARYPVGLEISSSKAGYMRTDTIPAWNITASSRAWAGSWRTMVMALILLTSAFSFAGLALPTTAQASTMMVDQCNGHGPGTAGATTAMKCTVSVVNTISGTTTYSTTTVTRLCTIGPCSTPNGTFTTNSISLVNVIRQCNNSDNDAAHKISCSVSVTNNVVRDTPGAEHVSPATVNQCVGSATGGGGVVDCKPATATGTTLTQCNGSGNGGGGAVHCTLDPMSRVSAAVPITVNQCNGTGNVGGSGVRCTASIITNIKSFGAAAAPKPTPTPTPTQSATPSQSTQAPVALAQHGTVVATGTSTGWWMLGAALVLVAAVGALAFRRFAPADLQARLASKDHFRRFARRH